MARPYHLSSVSWNVINSVGLEVATNYALLKRAFPCSVIRFNRGYLGILNELKHGERDRKLPWKSYKKIKKVIEQLIMAGLAFRDGDKIILTPKKESAANYSSKKSNCHRFIKLEREAEIKPQLAAAMTKSYLTRIGYSIAKEKAQAKNTRKELMRMYRGLDFNISLKQFAKLWGVSSTTAKRILLQISHGFGLTVKKSQRSCVRKCTWSEWGKMKEAGVFDEKIRCDINSCFWYCGKIFYQSKTMVSLDSQVL